MNRFFLSAICIVSTLLIKAQTQQDTLEKIFSENSFTIKEEYYGDWAGYTSEIHFDRFGDSALVTWVDPTFPVGETLHKLCAKLSHKSVLELMISFSNCMETMKVSKRASTEHSYYIFTAFKQKMVVDDRTTRECEGMYKNWKEEFRKKAK